MDRKEHFAQSVYMTTKPPRQARRFAVFFVLGALLLVLITLSWHSIRTLNSPDPAFPVNTTITINDGMTIRAITDLLDDAHVVRSSLYLYVLLQLHFEGAYVQAGSYSFPEPLSAQDVADAITKGAFIALPAKITFPEGFTVHDMHAYLPERFATSSLEALIPYEGYLFPDTYFTKESDSLDDIIALMRANYETQIAPLRPAIEASGFTEKEIIILASILEREANDPDSMREVAGILKHRLSIDMPLQVDAAFEYILGKASHELTIDDLEMDSPYNTYTKRGLPPTPIANPGLIAIEAIIEAPESEYLYYLTGNDGNFYYARTFEEHKANRARHLR